jgi:hypothetical protein
MSTTPTASHDQVLAVVTPSPARRAVGIGALTLLGGLLLYLGFVQGGTNAGATLVLLAAGLGGLGAAEALRRGSARRLELTETELRDSSGRRLALVADVRGVERGAFAFKPSNGFMLRLAGSGPFQWAPGLWWRIGGRVGVGGVTSAHQTKAMAEILSFMLAERDGAAR